MIEKFRKITEIYGVGSGNPYLDLLVIVSGVALIAIIFSMITYSRYRAARRENPARFDSLMGRLERVERTINDFKTEATRSLELLKVDLGLVRAGVSAQGRPEKEDFIGTSHYVPTPVRDLSNTSQSWIVPESHQEDSETIPESVETPAAPSVEASDKKKSTSLSEKLVKTRTGFFSKIRSLFSAKPVIDKETLEELEAHLISSDLGVKTVTTLIDEVRKEVTAGQEIDEELLRGIFKQKVVAILEDNAPLDPTIQPVRRSDGPLIVIMVGVNGVGKTTTTAKLASGWKSSGARVLMVAADTFRAAAVDQLLEWGKRIDVPVVTGLPEAKPATVVFDAMTRASKEDFDVVIIDTAGRLHTKTNLMQELEGIKNIIRRTQPEAPHETILVVDGATGNNAVSQAREFNEAVPLTGLIVTKLDGTPKGGIVVAIKNEIGVPVRYIGVGESPEDLRPFESRDFVEALFDPTDLESLEQASAHGAVRRRRRAA